MKQNNVVLIGADLTSNGGIASVIKSYYESYLQGNYNYEILLLKTNFYKDKGIFFELLILIKSIIKILYLLIFRNVGILHIHTSAHFSFYRKSIFVIIGKIFRKKLILHIHASDFNSFFLSTNFIIDFVIKLCDYTIVLCADWEVKLKIKYPNSKIYKIENPFQTRMSIGSTSLKNDQFNVLFVGFLIESKGVKDIIELAKLIKNHAISDIVIKIAGKGDLEDFIKEKIIDYSLEDVLKMIGWISGNNKDLAFGTANAFFLPSYKEGMPVSILEAMSYGLPIISTQIAGIPDIVESGVNGYLFSPGDVNGFFNAILKLKQNRNLCETFFTNNINRVKSNSKEEIYKQVDNLYKELTNTD